VAARVLAEAAPELKPPTPVRKTGVPPLVVAAEPTADHAALAWRVAQTAIEEVAAVGSGRVAVLAPEQLLTPIAAALAEAGSPVVDPRDMRRGGLADPLVLLAAGAANGLEFDAVVVAEPSMIAGTTARGLRTLYVALTRPTQRLTMVHAEPLPAPLAGLD
jgi:DNA helicase IV